MSFATSAEDEKDGEKIVREMLANDFEPHLTSRQAKYHEKNGRQAFETINRHDDGANMFREFGMTPFWKALRREQRALERGEQSPVLQYPETYLNALVHVNDAEKAALEANDMRMFEDTSQTRRKTMEFLAEHPEYHSVLEDGGKDVHGHAKPGRGKSSFLNVVGTVRNAEINNDTIIWALTLDELEVLPLAPWMTILAPAGVDINAVAKPTAYQLPDVEIDLEDIFRDVVRYTDPIDIFEKVVPGGIYGVLPDPHFRLCEELVNATYISGPEADEPNEITPLRDYAHALLEVRAKRDVFLHRTTLIVDEFGDLVPENPEDNEHDEKDKVNEWPKRYGKLRKKDGSMFAMSHSLSEPTHKVLEKERWFATMPRTPVPSSSRAGLGDVALPSGKPKFLDVGSCFIWDSVNYVEVSWPNPYRRYDFQGQVDISYSGVEVRQ
ncbi:hypothetical protein [Halolamina salifodinae]|uniref:Uncharacterized protein n=1 Tax=Halolamina salifodinae TaxID=1202767 RepID=A0A8T4GXE8_9EURY|nr:hypothetical protein [Halolamina salifodinae]MBP1985938.1 hypothetical protein [Halolamina salifodinae]